MQKKPMIGLLLVCLLLAGFGLQWFLSKKPQPPSDTTLEQQPATAIIRESVPAAEIDPAEDTVQLPAEPEQPPPPPITEAPYALENSDSTVLLAAAQLSSTVGQWLLPEQQIRKWVLTTDLIADGKLPRRYRPVDYPIGKFATEKDGENIVASDANFDRATQLINTVASIDTQLLARYYNEWSPLLEKAYREQGKPGTFDQRLQQTISQIMAVGPPPEKAVLERTSVLYTYKDEKLEQASDIEKLLWRMGPENSEKLQSFLRDLRNQLDDQE